MEETSLLFNGSSDSPEDDDDDPKSKEWILSDGDGKPPSIQKMTNRAIGRNFRLSALESPWLGLAYSIKHPHLWKFFVLELLILWTIDTIVFLFLYFFTANLQGKLIPLIFNTDQSSNTFYGVYLVILETGLIGYFVSSILLDRTLRQVYDEVWRIQEWDNHNRSLMGVPGINRLTDTLRVLILGGALYLVSFPCNLIPFIGLLLFYVINGWMQGWLLQLKFLSAKGFDLRWQFSWVAGNYDIFTLMGVQLVFFAFIPLFSSLFQFFSIIGAALLAGKITHEPVFQQLLEERWRIIENQSEEKSTVKTILSV